MNRLEKIKLTIYENTELSDSDKNKLLILAEEKSEDLSDEDRKANRIYMGAYKEATFHCSKDIKDVKDLISDGRYVQAEVKLKIARHDLKKLDKIVDETPSTLSQTAISQCVSALANALAVYAVESAIDKVFAEEKKQLKIVGKEFINRSGIGDTEKKILNKNIDEILGKPSITDNITDEVSRELFKDAIKLIKGGNPITDRNKFKSMAHKKIAKEIEILDKLERKISKLKAN